MPSTCPDLSEWLRTLQESQSVAKQLLSPPAEIQQKQGYFHTLHEICHQPISWIMTSELAIRSAELFRRSVDGVENIVLTGSGSSEYAGDCVRMALQDDLGIPANVVGGGTLVTHGSRAVPPARPALMVSLARSGDSPESFGAVSRFLGMDQAMRHLVLTCNRAGRLASDFSNSQVGVFTLDDLTNDRSLVMTSSFTNLVLAARFLGYLSRHEEYRELCNSLSGIAERLLLTRLDEIAAVAGSPFRRAVFLASGGRFGGAREAALKMLEMTSGRIPTMCETYLGFRHGPMSFAHGDTLIICFLSSNPSLRAFESDLLMELNRKELGLAKMIVGECIPTELLREGDLAIDCAGLAKVGDENASVIDVLVGQLLGFFRCINEGLSPDSPSAGIINRVVQSFTMHFPDPKL